MPLPRRHSLRIRDVDPAALARAAKAVQDGSNRPDPRGPKTERLSGTMKRTRC